MVAFIAYELRDLKAFLSVLALYLPDQPMNLPALTNCSMTFSVTGITTELSMVRATNASITAT